MPPDPFDADAPLRTRFLARGPALAVLAALVVAWARLISLWTRGVIKSEPFFGSIPWNVAITLPALAIVSTWWLHRRALATAREAGVSSLMRDEPLAGWHRRIRQLDGALERGTPTRAADLQIWRLTLEIVEAYPRLRASERELVRLLWRTYENFGVYASTEDRLEEEPSEGDGEGPVARRLTEETVRRELLLESIRDQLPDARDAMVGLGELRAEAIVAGIDFEALAREVAMLSDDTRRDAMFGSTRELFLRQAHGAQDERPR